MGIELTQGAGLLRVAVVDDGVGIAPDFDPATTTSLGLSIVRGLVAELGGTITFSPDDAAAATAELRTATGTLRRPGTRVSLTVPVVRAPDAKRPPHGGGRSVGL